MFASCDGFGFKIISVVSPGWESSNTFVAPRPFNALSFRLTGDAEFSDKHRVVRVKDNDMLFMPEGIGYRLNTGKEKIIAVHFEAYGFESDVFEAFTPDNPDYFRELFMSLSEIWNTKKAGYGFRASSVFNKILEGIVKQQSKSEHGTHYRKIKDAVNCMNTSYTDSSLSVDKLCKLSSMSDTYFRKLFFEEFGVTPIRYLTDLRINYAVELLESGYYTVSQIASNSGFSDSKYFSTVFRKAIGCSPSDYLKRVSKDT